MTRSRAAIAIALFLVGAALSWALLQAHHGEGSAGAALCGDGASGVSGCDAVNRSAWSRFLGVPLAAIGLAFYLSLALLLLLGALAGGEALAGAGFVALALLALALLVDGALFGIQAFAIRQYCWLCLTTYSLNVAALVSLLPWRWARPAAAGQKAQPAGRALLAAWLAGSAAFALSGLALHQALLARASLRQATLLGTPAPASPAPAIPAPAPSAPTAASPAAAPASEAERYKQEAARLQAILDDSQKLDQYFAEKAAREYAAARVQKIDLSDVPMKGPVAAPVTVVTYSDFLCPFCRSLAAGLDGYLPKAQNRVTLFFKNYPLDQACNPNMKRTVHEGACALALGAVCASRQGKFWPYHDRVFQTPPPRPALADVERLGSQLGLDAAAFKACLASPQAKEALSREIAEAVAIGVEATPTVFINGKKLPRINDFAQVVDQEAAKQGVPPLAPAGQ
jgi:protein-disulfide isomerase/uncharacterized membrane protein